jgi:prephenate dehydrogenase
VQFNKVAIIGIGLLGGSLGRALRESGLASRVVGHVRRPATIDECRRVGATDHTTLDLAEAVSGADLVVLCTPIGQMGSIALQMRPHLAPDAVVTDVGSVKQSVIDAVEPVLNGTGASFVGAHPMAGSERTGVLASDAALYQGRRCVLTPTLSTSPAALARVTQLWRSVGARTLEMTAAQHDACVARSSHLPHVLAAILAHHVLDPGQPPGVSDLCATGFKDTTRIASGSPEMWRDIALANRPALRDALAGWDRELRAFSDALDNSDGTAIERFLTDARNRREAWLERVDALTTNAGD